MAKVYFTFS